MAQVTCKLGRRRIVFTDHALDRWWERCVELDVHGRQAAVALLHQRVSQARWCRDAPVWNRASLWHRARTEGYVILDADTCFCVNRDPDGTLVAVTFIRRARARLSAAA